MSKQPYKEVPGNAIQSQANYERYLLTIARDVLTLENYVHEGDEERPTIFSITVKCDPMDEQGVLLVLRGYFPQSAVVAFQRGDTLSQALAQAGRRLKNKSMKWKEDQYAKNNGRGLQ